MHDSVMLWYNFMYCDNKNIWPLGGMAEAMHNVEIHGVNMMIDWQGIPSKSIGLRSWARVGASGRSHGEEPQSPPL